MVVVVGYLPPTTAFACVDGPFTSVQEARAVYANDPDCFALRIKYDFAEEAGLAEIEAVLEMVETTSSATSDTKDKSELLQQLQSQPREEEQKIKNLYDAFGIEITTTSAPLSPEVYEEGVPPQIYYQNRETLTEITFGSGPEATTYVSAGESFIDQATGQKFNWDEIQQREGIAEQLQLLRVNSDVNNLSSSEAISALLKRPDPTSGMSHPLSPNFFMSMNANLTSLPNLPMNVPPGPKDLSANTDFNPFSAGVFSPIQNLVVGLSNGITTLFELAFRI